MARTKLVVVALILLAGSVVCGAAAPELVQVGKLKVEAKIEGAGSPAVIFESGFTGGLFLWGPVQSQVGNETQTLSYERAGLGRSDLSAEPRSAERIARELHALLAAKAIAPPYILVGHSAGGLYVRIFAHMYPNEIAGLVLVDPATEEDYERMQKDKTVEDLEKMGMPAGAVAQWRALPETIDQARHAWPLPAVPVIVLTSKKPIGQWPLATAEDMQRWLEAHNQLAARIPAAEHIVIPGADHLSILKEGAVVEQITKMVDGVRAKRRQLNPAMLVRVPLRSHQLNSRRYMQSSRLPIKVALTTALAVLIAGCAAPTAVVQGTRHARTVPRVDERSAGARHLGGTDCDT
jgi:pimeloyl-ACP methyl ester carboxylesterase